MSLASPTKRAKIEPLKLVDDRQQTASPASVTADEVDDTRDIFNESEMTEEQLRRRYIGDIHLPQGTFFHFLKQGCSNDLSF